MRPTGITVTAWLWIATGGLMILSGAMAAIGYFAMGQIGPPPELPAGMPPGFAVMTTIFRHFGVLILLQSIVAGWRSGGFRPAQAQGLGQDRD